MGVKHVNWGHVNMTFNSCHDADFSASVDCLLSCVSACATHGVDFNTLQCTVQKVDT